MSICTEDSGETGGFGQTLLLTDIATKNVICLPEDGTVGDAARTMAELRISSIVVTDAGRPVGIVTERNILLVMHTGCPQSTMLRDVMSSPVIAVLSSVPFLDAYQLCQRQRIRHLVIMDEAGTLVGVASETDFRMHMSLTALAGHRLVASVMTRSILGMPPEVRLEDALGMMRSHRDNCVVVIEKDLPVGIVTERDVVRLYSRGTDPSAALLRDVMTSPVLTVLVDESINEVARVMLESRVRHLVAVDELGRLAGLISEHDLTQVMALGLMDDRMVTESSFLRTLINSIPDLVWLKNAEGVYLACNARFEQMMGAREAAIIGRTDYDFVDKCLADGFRSHDRAAMAAGKPIFSEEWLTFASDDYRGLFETIKTPMQDNEGKLVGVLGVARDISRRRKLEERLEESENKFRSIFESVNDCIEIISMDGLILDMNRAGYELLGYAREEMVGSPLSRFVAPEYASRIPERMALISEKGQARFESARLGKDGRIVPLEVDSRTIELNGRPAFLGIARDISERKRADAELRASEEKLRSLYELSPMGIALTDMQGHYMEFNDAFRDICGYTRDELNRLDYWALTPEEYAEKEAEQLESLGTRGYYGPYEKEYIRKDGNRVPLRLNGVLVHGSDGQPCIWSIVEDITERKKAEAVLAESESRYRNLVEHSPFCIHEVDLEGRIQSMNRAGLEMMGLEDEKMIRGIPYESAVCGQDKERVMTLMQKAFGGEASHFEFVAAGKKPLYFKSCFIPIRDVEGRVTKLMGITEDITEAKRAGEAIRSSLREYSELVQRIPVGVYKLGISAEGAAAFDYVSPRWCEMNGLAEDEAMGNSGAALGVIHPDDLESFMRLHEETVATLKRFVWEGRTRQRNGEIRWMHIEAQPTLQENGGILLDGIQYEVTDRRLAEDALRLTASVFDNSQEAILITDADNFIVDVNPAFTRITGYSREESIGRNPKFMSSGKHTPDFYAAMWQSLKENGAWRGEIWNRRKNGPMYAELLSISVILDGKGRVQRYVGVFSDISYLKEHEAELSRVAHYDSLTGIPNRVLLADRMKQAIAQTSRERTMMAVCYLDLDGFKPINDTLGHEAGDQVLIEVARRIIGTIRGGDTVARLGGDEFVILLLGLEKAEECAASLERLLHSIAMPIAIMDRSVTIGASIGVSIYPLEEEDADTLLRHADQAMYLAKQAGRHRFHIYDPSLDQRARSYNEFMKQIGHALESGQFELYYQPKIDLKTKALIGAEALIRWNHPEKGLQLPGEFLHAVENTELDARIGEWVIDTSLEQLDRWRDAGLDIEVSINISAHHLESKGFAQMLGEKLAGYPGLPSGRLQIEVLETNALEDVEVVSAVMSACRELGVWFALDDFGTGYSSLFYLSRLPVDVLKIDQSFVRDMLEDRGDLAIVQGIIALARSFGRQTVAEGIETGAHYLTLVEMGCEIGQGYGIAPPMPAGELIRWKMV